MQQFRVHKQHIAGLYLVATPDSLKKAVSFQNRDTFLDLTDSFRN